MRPMLQYWYCRIRPDMKKYWYRWKITIVLDAPVLAKGVKQVPLLVMNRALSLIQNKMDYGVVNAIGLCVIFH